MDCYFAQVEERDNPKYKKLPIAIGGPPDTRSVLSTANYVARKFGVSSAMSSSKALRLCPDLILLNARYDLYKEISQEIRSVFYKYTDKVEPLSLDEAFLDVTRFCQTSSASKLAATIRDDIFKTVQLTASAGIAPNKLLAKITSDLKKPNGQFTLPPSKVDHFMKTLSVKKIPGVGAKTFSKMEGLKILNCEDLQKLHKHELIFHFGKFGASLYQYARGIDTREVQSNGRRKSLSVETTFSKDLELNEAHKEIRPLYNKLKKRIQHALIKDEDVLSIQIKVKFFDFTYASASRKFINYNEKHFKEAFFEIINQKLKPIRLIGFGITLKEERNKAQTHQISMFDDL